MNQNIASYVFTDIETTGLPWQERNQTKITELSFVAVSRDDILRALADSIIPMSKLSLNFDPQRNIAPIVTTLTGLSNDLLQFSTRFDRKLKTIISFLEELPKPICLVAHNGNRFDYKILLAEFEDANVVLPKDLLCADSLTCFQKLMKNASKNTLRSRDIIDTSVSSNNSNIDDSFMTDDEDEWPCLTISSEEWQEIDDLCSSFSTSQITFSPPAKQQRKTQPSLNSAKNKNCSLSSLYEQLLNKKAINAHRAECDCLMLLECAIAKKNDFLQWVDENCQYLSEIKPLKRY